MTINYKSLAARLRFLSSVCGLALLTVLTTTGVVAQVGPPTNSTALAGTTAYSFAQSSGTYSAITGGTVFQSGATMSTNAVSASISLGFSFVYNNRSYSSIFISNNGFITFGATAPLASTTGPLAATTAFEGAVSGIGANLLASSVVGATPEIRYETLGTAPNRVFVVQFKDVGIVSASTTQRLNFQIRLTETSNTVAIVYGTCTSAASTSTPQIGLRGSENSDANNRTGTNWTSTTQGSANNSTCTLGTTNGTTVPASGLTFTWTPGSTWGAATYSVLPYLNDFSTWTNGLNTADIPGSNVRTWPSRGDNSWRASTNAVTGFTSTVGWSGTLGNTATFAAPAVAPAARFHDYDVSAGIYGDMDFYLNMSSSPIGLYNISLVYNNPTGTDALQIWYSGDGGATFTQLGANVTSAGNNWTSVVRQTAGTATSVIRLRGLGTFGSDDIYIDNFTVTALTCAPPTALLFTPNGQTAGTLSWTNPTSGTPTNYEYEVRTSGVAGSGSTGLVTSGSVANPTSSVVFGLGT